MAFWKMDVAESLKVRLERSAAFFRVTFPMQLHFPYNVILDYN